MAILVNLLMGMGGISGLECEHGYRMPMISRRVDPGRVSALQVSIRKTTLLNQHNKLMILITSFLVIVCV